LLSENLFGDGIERQDVITALAPLLKSGCVEVVTLEEIKRRSINRKESKNKLSIILSSEDYNNEVIWRGLDRKESIRSSVLIVENDFIDNNYLYLEGVIGLARALMADKRFAIKSYYDLMAETPLTEDKIGLLNDDALNNISFALAAKLKFKPITRFNPQEISDRINRMVTFLINA
jgi:hypothetical protein